jgi:hypothetical protein
MKRLPSVMDRPHWDEAIGLLPLAPVLVYQITYMNSFYPITEGWFSEYGALVRQGAVPYRDFILPLPPLFTFFIAGMQSVFGEWLLPLHWAGLGITALIGMSLYGLLRQLFPQGIAGIAAGLGLLYYQSGNAFIGYDFTQVVTLLQLLAALSLVLSLPSEGCPADLRHIRRLAFLAGACLSLAVLTKQSNASVFTVIVNCAMALVISRLVGLRAYCGYLISLTTAFLIPLLCVLSWLSLNGALGDCVSQVFTEAAAAKGGLYTSLTQWTSGVNSGTYHREASKLPTAAALAFVLVGLPVGVIAGALQLQGYPTGHAKQIWLLRPQDTTLRTRNSLIIAVFFSVSLTAVVLLVRYADSSLYSAVLPRGEQIYSQAILAAVRMYFYGGLIALVLFLLRPMRHTAIAFLYLAFGVGLACGNGTSAGLSEISAFLGVSLATAVLLRTGLPYVLPAMLPVAISLVFATYLIDKKYDNPYHWWSIESGDIRHAEPRVREGMLAGLRVPSGKYAAIQTISNTIAQHSAAGQEIYVFPHMPIFYRLADRPPFSGAVVSWFDCMSDRQAETVANALQQHPPAVLVVAELPDAVFAAHEELFRGGKPLGQRQIVTAINTLHRNGRIREVVDAARFDGLQIRVYARTAEILR